MKLSTLLVALVVVASAVVGGVWLASDRPLTVRDPANPNRPQDDEIGPPISPKPPWPQAVVEGGKEYKFGGMVVGETREHTFIIKNEGQAPLLLEKGETTCKCTLSELADREIPPGGQAEVTLAWTPKDIDPGFRQEATVHTNDPKNDPLLLVISGPVGELVTLEPAGDWQFGVVGGSQPRSIKGRLYSTVLDSFQLLSVETPADYLSATFRPLNPEELDENEAQSGYEITLTAEPDVSHGEHTARVTVKTDIKDLPEMQFTASLIGQGPVTAMPFTPPGESQAGMQWLPDRLALDLGRFPQARGKTGWYALIVRGLGEAELDVRDIEKHIENFNPEDLEVTVERDEKFQSSQAQRYIVTFRVKPGARKGTHLRQNAARVILKMNLPKAEEIQFILEFVVT